MDVRSGYRVISVVSMKSMPVSDRNPVTRATNVGEIQPFTAVVAPWTAIARMQRAKLGRRPFTEDQRGATFHVEIINLP